MIYREYTECYSISFLFLFFFHQSSPYPIKIFAKCFYLLVGYMDDGQKKNRNKNGKLTLCVFPIYHSTILPTVIHNACRRDGVIIGNTQSVSIPFLFLFFFHQSSLYPIKIFAKWFYLLVCILFSAPYAHAHISMSTRGSIDDCACT